MKTAENRCGDDVVAVANAMVGRHRREVGGIRNAGSESDVRTPAIVVRDPLPEDSAEVTIVERHHPVEAFAANRAITRNCCAVQSAVGWSVTFQWQFRREPTSNTTNT